MKRLGPLLGQATELGMTMGLMAAGFVVLGLVVGRWLDARLGSSPAITIICILAGAIAGQIGMYRLAVSSAKRLSAGTEKAWAGRDVLSASSLALRLLALIALPGIVGLALGLWLDRVLGSGAVATLILVLGGLLSGLVGAVRFARNAGTEEHER